MNRKLPKRIVSILLVTMLIISLPITNLHRTEAAAKKVKVKFFACSGTFNIMAQLSRQKFDIFIMN